MSPHRFSKRCRSNARRSRRQAFTLVEVAFGVVILLIVLLGIIEFAGYTRNKLIVANAARDGVRAIALGHGKSSVNTRIINSASPLTITPNQITYEYSTDSGTSYQKLPPDIATAPPANSAPSGSLVRVTLNVRNRSLTGMPIIGARTIAVAVVMVRERI